jgi:hypothetical protein
MFDSDVGPDRYDDPAFTPTGHVRTYHWIVRPGSAQNAAEDARD